MYKDVSEELVVNVIKSQNEMITKIHQELIKYSQLLIRMISYQLLHFIQSCMKQLQKQMPGMIYMMYMRSIVRLIKNGT